jgi:hypothetical protein
LPGEWIELQEIVRGRRVKFVGKRIIKEGIRGERISVTPEAAPTLSAAVRSKQAGGSRENKRHIGYLCGAETKPKWQRDKTENTERSGKGLQNRGF